MRVFVGVTAVDREQRQTDTNNKHGHRRHQLTARNHDWQLRTDTERLMQLLGQGTVHGDHPTGWLLPPPPTALTEPEAAIWPATSSVPVDWRSRRRRPVTPRRPANIDGEAERQTTNVDVLPTSNHSRSSDVSGCQTAASTSTKNSFEERQPFPGYQPLLGGIFPAVSPTTSSTLLSSSLAYDFLATAALSSLRHASLLPHSTTSYDVISAAAALLQPRSHHFGAFLSPHASLRRPEVDHLGDQRVFAGSVLDLVVAPSQSETAAAEGREASDMSVKHSPCRRDNDSDQSSAVGGPRARCCVWRPY